MEIGPSKFEAARAEIEKSFCGPYPLDRFVIEGLLSRLPGIYIWFEPVGGRLEGYVGMASDLLARLGHWARDTQGFAEVYYRYSPEAENPKLERQWILKAGDLNKA